MPSDDSPTWNDLLFRNTRGAAIPNLVNALIALMHEPQLDEAFAIDASGGIVLRRIIPATPVSEPLPRDLPRLIDSDDISRLQVWLQWSGLARIARSTVERAVKIVAREHPLKT